MKPINFPEVNQEIGKEQPQYITLPSKVIPSEKVEIWNAWKPTDEELKELNNGGVIWVCQLTFGAGFHPVKLQINKPDFKELDKIADQEVEAAILKLNQEIKAGKVHLDSDQMKSFREQAKARGIEDIEEVKGSENPKKESKLRKLKPKKGGKDGRK